MSLFARKLSPIGIDIGCWSIKMAQLDLSGKRPRVVTLAQHEMPHESESPEQTIEAIRDGIGQLLRRERFRGRNVVMCPGAQQLFVQNVRLPKLPADEIQQVVCDETEQRLPQDFGDAEVRHLDAGEVRTPTASGEITELRSETILLACRRNDLRTLISLAESHGLRPIAVDIPSCAIVRASSQFLRRKSDEQLGLLLVDIGAGATTVTLTRGSEILLVKSLAAGGQSMDRSVTRKLSLSTDDAAMVRRQWASGDTDSLEPGVARSVGEAVRSEVESMAGELLMCIRYHGVTFRGSRIAKAELYGGEANPRISEQLAMRIDLACDLGDPFAGFDLSHAVRAQLQDSSRGQWAVALGLCLKPPRAKAA